MTSITRYVNLENWDLEEASLVLQLMLASNDIMMTDKLRELVKASRTREAPEFSRGTEQYLLRLLCAQLFEAIRIMPTLSSCNSIRIILNRDDTTREALSRLLEYKEKGSFQKSFRILKAIRNQAMFHYEYVGHYLKNQLQKRVKDGLKTGTVVISDNPLVTPRFSLADDINEMVFTYDLLGHHDGKNFDEALKESTKILLDVQIDFAIVATTVVSRVLQTRYR